MVKHIDALSEFLVQTLSVSERKYLVSKLSIMPDDAFKIEENKTEKHLHLVGNEPIVHPANDEFLTLTKRSIKYSVIKKKVLVQKPKAIPKLKNFIKQIGHGEGGFSDSTIENIISVLIKNEVLSLGDTETVNWLK